MLSGRNQDGAITERKRKHSVSLADLAHGIAVWKSTLYVVCQRLASILVLTENWSGNYWNFYAPGHRVENITVRDEGCLGSRQD